jgi:hypothetical protein
MPRTASIGVASVFLLVAVPSVAYAHGGEILAVPASGLLALIVGLPLILLRRLRWPVKGLFVLVLFGCLVAEWAVVAFSADARIFLRHHFWTLIVVGGALPPLLCAVLARAFRSSGNS